MSAIWVVELRRSKKARWKPQEMYDYKREAKNGAWEAVPPAVQRIVKYRRVERKKRKAAK